MTHSPETTLINIENSSHEGAFGSNPIPEPTETQCRAGNYKMGRVSLYGLKIAIEQPRNTYRTGVDPKTNKRWTSRVAAHYGYISATKGADGDGVDCFVGFYPQSEYVYVVNQNVDGRFDEHKSMIAFFDEDTAIRAYMNSYERGWKGLESIVQLSINQFKWWLKNGDMSRPIRKENLPNEGLEAMTKRVYWNDDAMPVNGVTLDRVIYEIRKSDSGENLIMDAVTVQEIVDDSDGVLTLDALVSVFSQLERKMELMRGIMGRAGGTVEIVSMQVSDPFKQNGVANVAVVFELSDGQTISVYFHNPDVTPQKMAPTDEVISWKWMLNKKDITIVVAPERGKDLSVREVARRIMKLAEKNSAGFARANAKKSERMKNIKSLEDEIVELEKELVTAQGELVVVKREAENKKAANKNVSTEVVSDVEIDPTTPEGYAKIMQDEALQLTYQDVLDSFFQVRMIAVRNALRELGWEGEQFKDLSKEGLVSKFKFKYANESIHNVIGYYVEVLDGADFHAEFGDNLTKTPSELAADINSSLPDEPSKNTNSNENVIELTGKELGDFPDTPDGLKALRNAARTHLESKRGKWVKCPAMPNDESGNIREVEMRQRGIDEFIRYSAKPEKLKLAAKIEEIIETSFSAVLEPNYKPDKKPQVLGYYRLKNRASIAGVSHDVTILIEQDADGYLHYDLILPDTKKAALDGAAFLSATTPANEAGIANENNIDTLDSSSQEGKGCMVINLFIEGEDPEVIEEGLEDKTSDVTLSPEADPAPESEPEPEPSNEYIQPSKSFESHLEESGGDSFMAAREFFKSEMQGKIVKTIIGDVHMIGSSWREMKRGMKSDELKAKLVSHVPEILSTGAYDGRTELNKGRLDHFVAFHFFEKEINIDGVLVTAGVNVGERSNGEYVYTVYSIGHDGISSWVKKKATSEGSLDAALIHEESFQGPGVPSEPTAKPGSSSSSLLTMDSILDEAEGDVNIMILKVIDQETGERVSELEDDFGQQSDEPEQLSPEKDPSTIQDVNKVMPLLKKFIGKRQLSAVGMGIRGEEGQFFKDKMVEIANTIQNMPQTYGQDGMGDEAIVYLHYFMGGSDWYITEKDMEGEQLQAFGLADLGDGGELGYISIQELIDSGVELDFYWDPKTIGEIKGPENKQDDESDSESSVQGQKEPADDNSNDNSVIDSAAVTESETSSDQIEKDE